MPPVRCQHSQSSGQWSWRLSNERHGVGFMGSNAGQDGTMVINSMDGLTTIYTRGREVSFGGVKAIDNGIGG